MPAGRRLCIHHPGAAGPAGGNIVFVHAFAEEMNKSRRMVALQARALAAAGYQVLQIDLFGCGDSSGELVKASWQGWVEDVHAAMRWLSEKNPGAPLWLWGHRAGCLLAVDAARSIDLHCNFLFWQPAPSGKLLLQQFLRLRLAADLAGGTAKGQMNMLLQQLHEGGSVEVAGYELPAALADGLSAASLQAPSKATRALFIEIGSQPTDGGLSPALAAAAQRWSDAGACVLSQFVQGPPFWHTVEIEDAPALLPATLALLRQAQA